MIASEQNKIPGQNEKDMMKDWATRTLQNVRETVEDDILITKSMDGLL